MCRSDVASLLHFGWQQGCHLKAPAQGGTPRATH